MDCKPVKNKKAFCSGYGYTTWPNLVVNDKKAVSKIFLPNTYIQKDYANLFV